MMLQNVRLINYRGLKDATIPLAPITLLTGMNGAGKTSVLEGLYCLLSQPVPDVAVFPRYQASMSTQAVNVMWPTGSPNLQPPFSPVVKYDYPAFWKECSTDGASECQVAAGTKEFRLAWKMRISDFSELDHTIKDIATNYGLQGGANVPYALWEWEYVERAQDPRSYKPIKIEHKSKAVQQLMMELHVSPKIGSFALTTCRYVDMSSARYIPERISLQDEKLLTDALKIIDPHVTGVRHDGRLNRIRIIMNEETEHSLGTLGVGAEAWASVLLILADLVNNRAKNELSTMFLSDEIGAGIHYSKLEEMWSFLSNFLSKYPQIQMVLTTHSYDCIYAYCKTFRDAKSGRAKIVRLHKLNEQFDVKMTEYTQETFPSILSGEWEVRG